MYTLNAANHFCLDLGGFSIIFESNLSKHKVIKVGFDFPKDPYKDYINICKKYPNISGFPVIYKTGIINNFYYVVMEKLFILNNTVEIEKLCKGFAKSVICKSKKQKLYNLTEAASILAEKENKPDYASWDLCSINFMQRKNGEIVLVDPWCTSFYTIETEAGLTSNMLDHIHDEIVENSAHISRWLK